MRTLWILTFLLVVLAASPAGGAAESNELAIGVGSTREEVISAFGKPKGETAIGGMTVLSYDGGAIELQNGRVTSIQDGFLDRLEKRRAKAAFEEAQRAKGLVLYEGTWMTPVEQALLQGAAERAKQAQSAGPARRAARDADVVRVISDKGNEVSLAHVLTPGKITIVDFYARWCGPCRRISPYLERLARSRDGVHLRMIDIVEWDSPVARQYGITNIPHLRVYSPHGDLICGPTSDPNEVTRAVRGAR